MDQIGERAARRLRAALDSRRHNGACFISGVAQLGASGVSLGRRGNLIFLREQRARIIGDWLKIEARFLA